LQDNLIFFEKECFLILLNNNICLIIIFTGCTTNQKGKYNMQETIQVTLTNGKSINVPTGTTLHDLAGMTMETTLAFPVVGALMNNAICDLWECAVDESKIQFIDWSHPDGSRMLIRGLTMVLLKAVRDIFPNKEIKVLHSLSKGLFCRWEDETPMKKEEIKKIEKQMRDIINQNHRFQSSTINIEEARQIFEKQNMPDKIKLLRFRRKEMLKVYTLDGYTDYFFGRLPPLTGVLGKFELKYYSPGLILRFPSVMSPENIPVFEPERKLAQVYSEYKKWAEIMEVSDVASLNEVITNGEINDLIRVMEALHEKKIAQIADRINENRDNLKIILIAGPSSSGKTTFAQRLRIQLRVNGLRPITLSLDDYFLEKDRTPKDENGDYDFDHIEAIDIALFNDHLQKMMEGEEVSTPRYDFVTGKRIENHKKIKLSDKDILIVEGIHGLNERLTESVPSENKYKIYVSALTMLNLDNHNRLPTTDTRIIRRIVRDSMFRNHTASDTIKQWPMVRRGEERFIFPFQEEADVMFNSAMLYEISALKGFVEPLLKEITPDNPAYAEAKRLLSFTGNFIGIGTDEIPPNSILREFIGATCFFKMDVDSI
jgi:uridine kinase